MIKATLGNQELLAQHKNGLSLQPPSTSQRCAQVL